MFFGDAMDSFVLIDYDNVPYQFRKTGLVDLARRVGAVLESFLPGVDGVLIRLYGGWYDSSGLTREGTRITQLMKARDNFGLQRFCELHPLPIASGLWAANTEQWSPQQAKDIVSRLGKLTTSELRSTYLKQNAGTIAAHLATRRGHDDVGVFEFDSMYFEGDLWSDSALKNSRFKKCTFIGIDLSNARWEGCRFEGCYFDGLIFDEKTRLDGCQFAGDCSVLGVLKRRKEGEEGLKNFVFEECRQSLEAVNLQAHQLKPVRRRRSKLWIPSFGCLTAIPV